VINRAANYDRTINYPADTMTKTLKWKAVM